MGEKEEELQVEPINLRIRVLFRCTSLFSPAEPVPSRVALSSSAAPFNVPEPLPSPAAYFSPNPHTEGCFSLGTNATALMKN